MFKVGSKLVCVDDRMIFGIGSRRSSMLTINNIYIVDSLMGDDMVLIKNDTDLIRSYCLDRFISVIKYRKIKLKKLKKKIEQCSKLEI